VISAQRRRRPQQRHVGGRDVIDIKGNEVGGEFPELTAAPERDNDHRDDDRGGHDDEHHWHIGNRAMLGAMADPSGALPAAGTAVLAVAGTAIEAAAAVRAGAALVDLGTAGPAAIAAFRASHPGILVCAASGQADIVRDAPMALRTGAILACADPLAAIGAGLPAGRLLVEVRPARLPQASAAGYATLVDLRDGPDTSSGHGPAGGQAPQRPAPGAAGAGLGPAPGVPGAGPAAIAAICAWLGATVVRTSHPLQIRRALDMAEAIRGIRPPAWTVRGLG